MAKKNLKINEKTYQIDPARDEKVVFRGSKQEPYVGRASDIPQLQPHAKEFSVDGKLVSEQEFKKAQADLQSRKEELKILAEGGKKGGIVQPLPIPESREIVTTGVGAFEGADIHRERSVFGILDDTPLGQAIIGKATLDKLKEGDRGENIVNMTNFMLDNGLTPQQVSSDPATQMVLSMELNEQDLALIKSGETLISDMALLIEGLPVTRAITKIAGGALTPTTAYAKIEDLNTLIEKKGNKVRDYRMAAARTPANRDRYLELIEKTESEIRHAESRIKLLAIESSIMQNSPERLEVIQETSDRALNRIGDAKNAIAGGETMEQFMAFSAANPI